MMTNIVLQNFSSPFWNKYNLSDIPMLLAKYLQIDKSQRLGQFGQNNTFEIDLKSCTHVVDKCWWDPDKKIIYGDVTFLTTTGGRRNPIILTETAILAIACINSGTHKFQMNSIGTGQEISQIISFNIVPYLKS